MNCISASGVVSNRVAYWDTPLVDLTLSKTSSAAQAVMGQTIDYTLTVTNSSVITADNVVLLDTLPISFTHNSSSAGCAAGSGVVTCTVGSLAPNATAVFTMSTTAPNTTGIFTNTAVAGADQPDSNGIDNIASTSTSITVLADLALHKTAPAAVIAGETITYTLTITNNGPEDAPATLTDNLPPLTSYQTAVPSQGSCNESGGTVSCNLGLIAPSNWAVPCN